MLGTLDLEDLERRFDGPALHEQLLLIERLLRRIREKAWLDSTGSNPNLETGLAQQSPRRLPEWQPSGSVAGWRTGDDGDTNASKDKGLRRGTCPPRVAD
jgi:hypothetical protein